jgi:hypothetical protein
MIRANKNPMFKCGTAKYTDHYGCRSHTILQRDIETAVIASVRAYAAALIDRRKMNLALIERGKVTAGELEAKIRSERKAIQFLESSVTKIFTELASGRITKETFIRKKAVINGEIAVKREAAERMSAELKALTDGRSVADGMIAEMTPLVSLETLDRDVVDLLIDKILVHGGNDIEIVWNDQF